MSRKHLQDLIFFLDECVRNQQRLNDGLRPEREDVFCTIPHPAGRGSLIAGRAAFDALDRLAADAAKTGGIARRVKAQDVRKVLIDLAVSRFLVEGVEPSDRTVARLLRDTHLKVRSTLTTRTFLVPCHLSTQSEPEAIEMGPVRFVGTATAQGMLRRGYFKVRAESEHFARDRRWLLQALRHYRGFRWFAEVTVEGCDDDRAREIAQEAATAALNFVHLVVGGRGSRRMSIGGAPTYASRTSSIHFSETGDLSFSTTMGYPGQVNLPKGWAAEMGVGVCGAACAQAGVVLESVVNPDLERPVSRRLLDAVQWFGEAVRDPSPSTRMVKYVTALEHLVLTGRFADVADAVSDRVAAMCTGLMPGKSFKEIKAEFKRVYGLRSSLVHGSISPSSAKVSSSLGAACDFAENSLNRALHNWHASALREQKHDQASLHDWFESLVVHSRSKEAQAGTAIEGGAT